MYRLLIVDDETVIADGLYEYFSKFEPMLDLYKAYSGFDALEVMKRNRVDIVMTDIRMPGMDGIQLMERIRCEWPHCKIIFLTGYHDFDYVYQAIQHAGVSYLLKTEGYPKVKDLVQAAVEQLDQDFDLLALVKQSQEHLHTLEALLQGEYVRHVLKGLWGTDELVADFDKLNIPLDPGKPILVVLGALHMPGKQGSFVNRQEAALAVKLLSDTVLQEHHKVKHLSVLDRYLDVLWLIQPHEVGDNGGNAPIRYLEGIFELIEQACTDALGISLACTIAAHPLEWESLPTGYEKLRQQQSVRVGDGTHLVQTVLLKGIPDSRSTGTKHQRSSLENADLLAIHLESGRQEEFFGVLEGIVETVGDDADPSFAMECYYSIAFVLLSHINRFHLTGKVNAKGLMSFEEHASWSLGYAYLKETARRLFEHRQAGEKKRATQAVDYVRSYIEAHLNEDLSLVRLAELIHINPSYLSRLFKQECGINLSEYIDEHRVKKAKELLKTHEWKIAEVGARVGYDAPHSFTRFFKKMTRLTPQEYRDGIH